MIMFVIGVMLAREVLFFFDTRKRGLCLRSRRGFCEICDEGRDLLMGKICPSDRTLWRLEEICLLRYDRDDGRWHCWCDFSDRSGDDIGWHTRDLHRACDTICAWIIASQTIRHGSHWLCRSHRRKRS